MKAPPAKNDEVKVFEHSEFGNLRVVERDGETWFVAKDVCRALDLGNVTEALRGLDADERGSVFLNTPGGRQEMTTISEAGLYSLVLRSHKPEAKPFRRWVTHDILPSIAKHGAYMTPETIEDILSSPDTIIRLATDLKAEREQRSLAETKALALAEPMDSGLLIPSAAGKGKLRFEPEVWRCDCR
ncbi:MAG: hypothetical protein A2051_06820 [Desulfovibrionales bacterium GWA2_65_9]|nr:MAG: hypothetical protein A2051_06820 [Desulfovibrionales bacterium GWA2_65_9]